MHPLISRRVLRRVATFVGLVLLLGSVTGPAGSTTGPATGSSGRGGPTISKVPWGTVGGQRVDLYTLTNSKRMTVRITNYGGIIQSIEVPDRRGRRANVALGFDNLDDYVTSNSPYFGCITGRYANRIANGRFTLDGVT
jgi:aldose 1-epimerase